MSEHAETINYLRMQAQFNVTLIAALRQIHGETHELQILMNEAKTFRAMLEERMATMLELSH